MKEGLICSEDRLISLNRAQVLRRDTLEFQQACLSMETGMNCRERAWQRKEHILHVLGGREEDWLDWKWQIRNRVKDVETLARLLELDGMEKKRIEKVGRVYRWAISPYYLSLIKPGDSHSPIYRQAVPDLCELEEGGSLDPMNEAQTSPAPCVTRRYPDRMIINVTNQCAMFCRHCQRRRNIGETDQQSCREDISQALHYVAANPEIRDVLITGGDALLLSDQTLDWILGELHQIPHVEIKRIGSRVPVTLPQRITPELGAILSKYPPIYINTQFNHSLEVTPEAKAACDRLVEAGVILGNQAVLLRGINDNPHVMKKLNQELLRIRVRPYYLFYAKDVRGTRHFRTRISKGLEIMEELRGHTSGLAVPTFIVNASGGLVDPVMPQYLVKTEENKVVLRTWEGRTVEIDEDDVG